MFNGFLFVFSVIPTEVYISKQGMCDYVINCVLISLTLYMQ